MFKSYSVAVIIPTTERDKDKAQICKQSVLDGTYKRVNNFVINIGKERSEQRNLGVSKAKSGGFDYILYLDSDQRVSERLIEECVELAACGFSALYIPEEITDKTFFGRLRNWERKFYTGTPIDCVRFIKTDICPMFSNDLNGPEDSDHDRRVKGLRATTKNVVYHDDNVTLKEYLSKKAYYSKSMAKFERRWPKDKVLNFWWRCFGVFFENGKWKRVLKRPDLFVCVMALILARGIIYLRNK